MTPLEVLTAARALIAEPEHWCRGTYARDKAGVKVSPRSPDAVSFCLTEAIYRLSRPDYRLRGEIFQILSRITSDSAIAGWQDTHTHAEVIGLLDQAIAEFQG